MGANAALFFVASEYDTARKDLKGRHAATEGFFKGFARHADIDRFFCWSVAREEAAVFKKRIGEWGRKEEVHWLPHIHSPALAEAGCVFLPKPMLAEDAWRRRAVGDHLYSLCGVAHTTASHAAMTGFADLLSAPVRSWDAVICPSQSILRTAQIILQDQADYLRWRLGAQKAELPQMPIIPLGIDSDASAFDEKAREEWRRELGIGSADIVLLFMGRLSFHAKAHPMPMYLAAQTAQQQTGKKIHLIQAGWFANNFIEKGFREGAKQFCPDVLCHFLDGRKPDVRRKIWSAADIFVSFPDNIQETFGLTPLEAKAAGLPVLASDWDGYRETIRKDIDGFLIPTYMPPPSLGDDLARAYESGQIDYDKYSGYTSQLIAVDVVAASQALLQLIENPALRKSMGEAGRIHARQHYDWKAVIPQYQSLWTDLAARRASAKIEDRPTFYKPYHPERPDPFHIFRHYSSAPLAGDTIFELLGLPEDIKRFRQAGFTAFADPILPSVEVQEDLLRTLQKNGPLKASDWARSFAPPQRNALFRSLLWLVKMGLIQIKNGP